MNIFKRKNKWGFVIIILAFLPLFILLENLTQDKTVVDKYGQLSVESIHIVNRSGEPVALHGMSMFWSQWGGGYYNYDCIKWLRDDWNCQVVRAAMAIKDDGYAGFPERETEKVKRVIDACIELGLYVIVDWHSHNAEEEVDLAISFYEEIAGLYGDHPNIIYEIYNEPVGTSWLYDVKPYAEEIIRTIRRIDPDNIIIVGSPHWAQDVDVASRDPLEFSNIAYSLHFYAATHKQWLRDKADIAIENGLALWVTEFGTCKSDGDGRIDYLEMQKWYAFMEKNTISWCNWAVGEKEETSAILKPGADTLGGWPESALSESGNYIRKKMREMGSALE